MVLRTAIAVAVMSGACDSYRTNGADAATGDAASAGDAASPDGDCADCEPGCADGEREGFVDLAAQPAIAGCSGGFSLPGLLEDVAPACDRAAGDDGDNPSGDGCNAGDLCAEGWHVCRSVVEVAEASSSGDCAEVVPEVAGEVFFATRQSGPGYQQCGEGANDLFGCGSVGRATKESCWPLDRESWDLCSDLASSWSCGDDPEVEAMNASKIDPAGGGVLCCRG